MATAALAEGASIIKEAVRPNCMLVTVELARFGAYIGPQQRPSQPTLSPGGPGRVTQSVV